MSSKSSLKNVLTPVASSRMGKPILVVENLTKTYNKRDALCGVNIEVFQGEFLSLIGPSGSGKSTFLKIIAGVETATGGHVRYQGGDIVSRAPESRNDLIMVWQSLALFPHMSVGSNVAFGLAVRRVPTSERNERVAEALKTVGLAGYQNRRIHELSGGEQQRIALARALVLEPSVLLLDEPFGSLDAYLRAQLQSELRQLHAKTRKTFIMVTHDQSEAIALSNRIAVINRGRIEQQGTPEEIVKRPITPFVARFVGNKNVFEGILVGVGETRYVVRTAAGDFIAGEFVGKSRKVTHGAAVAYVVDAAHICLGQAHENRVKGYVLSKIPHGSVEVMRVQLDGGEILMWEYVNIKERSPVPPSYIDLSWDKQDAYLIHCELQRRL